MSAILPITSPGAGARDRIPPQTLGQGDFLKLLVTQMTTQDPLNPQTDRDFIAQMAQFSALEQSKSMSSDMAQLRAQQGFLQAGSLLGRTVAVQAGGEALTHGVVEEIMMDDGTPKLLVSGQAYDLSQVLSFTPTLAAP